MAQVKGSIVAVVWAPEEARTEMFARRLNAQMHHVHFLKYKRPFYAPFKYPLQWVQTWLLLAKARPAYVYVTNPPVFAGLSVYFFCLLSGTKFIMDTHSPALYSKKWGWSLFIQRWVATKAAMNVTDQLRFKRMFEAWGSKAIVLERPPKLMDVQPPSTDQGTLKVAVINTFAEDEPLQCILEAAKLLPNVEFYITGDIKRASQEMMALAPANCTWTDYLRGEDYWDLLRNCDMVLALTTFPYSLLGGAQDAMALGKPVLVSDQPALREYFYRGTLFVGHAGSSIAEAVKIAGQNLERLSQEMQTLRDEHAAQWNSAFHELEALVQH
jgi:glycosyltransferase involved in cell wall biosynthesis